ncbi:MAG: citramalate synthase [Candidatus Gastranaerophilales bacterium]|nr:citramalate synthase [Candidatus Gastranaerophilales bacterium]
MKKIEIYDTTLRDGAQSEGINFSTSDKLKIVRLLDDLGIDYIEAGWPGANPKDEEVFRELKKADLKNSKIAAFGCTRKADTKPEENKVLSMLLSAETEVVTIFGKTWDFHVEHALCTTLDENLNMISDSIKYLKEKGRRVFFDAEHFFDGFKNNEEYALHCIKTAHEAGAERIILCDTNGGCMSYEISEITKKVSDSIPDIKLGIHAHNDSDMAVANSVSAVDAGAIQVQGTINGYGERCGNANLCSIIPNLQLKKNYEVVGDKIHDLTFIANNIAEIANVAVPSNLPYVGMSAFAHKAGIHASGVRKNSQTYEHISPDSVGNRRKILISDQAGTASLREKMRNLRIVKDVRDEDLPKIIERIKKLEWKGFAFEGAEASFELLILDTLTGLPDFFKISGFRVIGDTFIGEKNHNIITEASVKVKIDEHNIHTVAEGQGPVNALDTALRKALVEFYPEILKYKLCDFKVRILDSKDGTAAVTRVTVETTDGINKWDTVGVSEDIIEASYMAITDSIMYGLILHNPDIDF